MEEFLEGLGCRLRGSGMVADSIMMGIVNTAMEQAFEKACSREGVLERLNEKSRFCELAVMQLEWCLKFVEEETDNYVVVESVYERERLVSDLTETRDRIKRRLEETEFAILEKDRLLIERFENEVKLRHALELRDREIMLLEDQFDVHSGLVRIGDEGRDGGFCELKNSVDEQFFNIKQKLEDERMNFANGVRNVSPDNKSFKKEEINDDHQLFDTKGTFIGKDKVVDGDEKDQNFNPLCRYLGSELEFEKMGSDIDILKETLDIAFGMMSNAISLSEVRPMEQQWRWAIERNIFYAVFNGFSMDVQNLILKGEKNDSLVMIIDNHFQLMDDIADLLHELNQLIHESEEASKTFTGNDFIPISSKPNYGGNPIPNRVNASRGGKFYEVKNGSCILERNDESKTYSSHVDEKEKVEGSLNDDLVGQGLINDLHLELYEKDLECQLRVDVDRLFLREMAKEFNEINEESHIIQSHIEEDIFRFVYYELQREFLNGGAYRVVFHEALKKVKLDFNSFSPECQKLMFDGNLIEENQDQDLESMTNDRMSALFLKEVIQECNKFAESIWIESFIKEDMHKFILNETIKDVAATANVVINECQKAVEEHTFQNELSSNTVFQAFESLIKEQIYAIFYKEMIKEWKMEMENNYIVSSVNVDVCHAFIREVVKDRNSCLKISRGEEQQIFEKPVCATNEALIDVEKDIMIKKVECLSRCLKEEKDLILNASTELLEQSRLLELVNQDHENEHTAYCNEIFVRADEGLGSVNTKLTMAMDHIMKSRIQLKEYASTSNMTKEEPSNNEKILSYELPFRQSSLCLAEKNEDDLAQALSFISSVVELLREIDEFEHTVLQKIELNTLRLEEVKYQLDLSVEHVSSIRKKELLYRNAFYNRCCNLEKAEIEHVDSQLAGGVARHWDSPWRSFWSLAKDGNAWAGVVREKCYAIAMKFQRQVINAWESHEPKEHDEFREAHRVLEQLRKKARGASSCDISIKALPPQHAAECVSTRS
ncbi:hypothetical protein Sjap_006323 [Stephania japonica]|uniref:WPP domain-associated protein n=1 Tax=Stephania japonica TaxID=461633 RepID=A0AAP0K6T9_9MAGN